MDYIRIDNGKWDDCGIIYTVVEYKNRPGSTAVDLVLEYNDQTIYRTVASHQIEWLESKDC